MLRTHSVFACIRCTLRCCTLDARRWREIRAERCVTHFTADHSRASFAHNLRCIHREKDSNSARVASPPHSHPCQGTLTWSATHLGCTPPAGDSCQLGIAQMCKGTSVHPVHAWASARVGSAHLFKCTSVQCTPVQVHKCAPGPPMGAPQSTLSTQTELGQNFLPHDILPPYGRTPGNSQRAHNAGKD